MNKVLDEIKSLEYNSNFSHHTGDNKMALEYAKRAYILSKNIDEVELKLEVSILYCTRLQDYDLRSNWIELKEILIENLNISKQYELLFQRVYILYLLVDYTYLKREFTSYHIFYNELCDLLIINGRYFAKKNSLNAEVLSKIYLSRAMYLLINDYHLSVKFLKKSLIQFNVHKNKFLRFRCYIQLSRQYYYQRNKKGILILESLLNKFHLNNFDKSEYFQWDDLELEIVFTKAIYEYFFEEYSQALKSTNKALEISRRIKSIEMEGETLVHLCKISKKFESDEEFKVKLENAYVFCHKQNYEDLLKDLTIIEKRV
ncbi:hypothetical protein [Paenibacillus campi]|uniref:hypothetical protein n=1 Tax=Paenibacillus campi TaxID=3106031 RepID=UPI002B00272F|nr:hypothetical protein [Paenibacillus sp. SGZ-1014]